MVLDFTGAVLVGASVGLRAGDAPQRATVSDGVGRFAFESVPPGPVVLTVEASGFAPATVNLDRARTALRVVRSTSATSGPPRT